MPCVGEGQAPSASGAGERFGGGAINAEGRTASCPGSTSGGTKEQDFMLRLSGCVHHECASAVMLSGIGERQRRK
jgi:hypothetical protein